MAYGVIWNTLHTDICIFDVNGFEEDLYNTIDMTDEITYSHTFSHPRDWYGYNVITWDEFKTKYMINIKDLYKVR